MNVGSPLLDVSGVTLQYKTGRRVVTATRRVSFQVSRSDRLVLLGPSGCGKSTLLKAIGGFYRPTEGRITLRGKAVKGPGPDRVFVFQEFEQLLPWKTVRENVEFALTTSGKMGAAEARNEAVRYLGKVNLLKFLNAYPHTLSGGMKQRVAIARCLAMNPEIVLMDEPFASLDAMTRRKMQEEVLELWRESRFTLVFVTHSISEATKLGNRIVLLSAHPGEVLGERTVDAATSWDERSAETLQFQDEIQETLARGAIDFSI